MSDQKIWCVSSGSYSDYRVACCFTSRELAVQYAASYNGLTVAEQERLQEIDTLRWTNKLAQERDELTRKVRVYESMQVEAFDLFDHVPHADPADIKKPAR